MVFPRPLAVTLLPPSLTLLVVHLSSSQDVATEPSSEQQLCTLREHPTVAFADLKPWVFNFTYPGARDFSQLALDPPRNQLIVGARTAEAGQKVLIIPENLRSQKRNGRKKMLEGKKENS